MTGELGAGGRTSISAHPGELIAGKYQVEREIGRGGMGVVVAAMHVELEQRVAIKILRRAAAENPDFVARFSREARAAAKIKSEHVARVMDVGTLEGGLGYIVMEHLEGEDLAEVLRMRGALPVPVAVDFVLQACQAVAAAHAAGVVHRDLKPANLFLARQPDHTAIIKVLDFGVSKMTGVTHRTASDEVSTTGAQLKSTSVDDGSVTHTGDIFGSPTYMSPEQLRGSARVDTRADIWALGVVLFELITNQTPFWHGSFAEILAAVIRDPPPPLRQMAPGVPEELERIIERCLAKEPGQRYANVALLARALLPFGSGRATAAVERMERLLGALEVTAPAEDSSSGPRSASFQEGLPILLLPTALEEPAWTSVSQPLEPMVVSMQTFPASMHAGGAAGLGEGAEGAVRIARALEESGERAALPAPITLHSLYPLRRRERAWKLAALGGFVAAGMLAAALLRRGTRAVPTDTLATSSSSSAAVEVQTLAAVPTAAPVSASLPTASATAVETAEISLSVGAAPPGTKLYRGETLLGTVPGSVRLARSSGPLTLRVVAEGYVPDHLEIVPDRDRLVSISLRRVSRPPVTHPRTKTSKDLEPF